MAAAAYVICRTARSKASHVHLWVAMLVLRDRHTSLRTPVIDGRRERALAEVEGMAWLLDNSIPVPGTGGRRLGIDAIIGLVPGVGDLIGGALGMYVVWRGSRMGLPGIVVARMLINALVDMLIGAIPVLGDAFDLWFKGSTRNLALMRKHLERPGRSARDDWAAVLVLVGSVVAVLAGFVWLAASAIGALFGAFS